MYIIGTAIVSAIIGFITGKCCSSSKSCDVKTEAKKLDEEAKKTSKETTEPAGKKDEK